MNILIVEDNEQMRRMIKSVVAGCADDIRECASAAEAMAAYRARPAEYVLMDIKLPGMDGIAAAAAIRGMDPNAYIVIVTNYDDENLRQSAWVAGCRAYVLKSDLLPLRDLLVQRGEH